MSSQTPQHIFWGSLSPLAGLTGGGLLIMASSRLAYAVTVSGALLWVYAFSALAASAGTRIFPKRGRFLILMFLASFTGSVYLLLLWLINPLTAMEVFFAVSLVPLCCAGSGMFSRIETDEPADAVTRALSEAAVLGGLIVIFAIIREPLGFLSLSLPGGGRGIVLLFSFKDESFLPIRLIAGSAGALLLLGYGAGLYRCFRSVYAPREEDR